MPVYFGPDEEKLLQQINKDVEVLRVQQLDSVEHLDRLELKIDDLLDEFKRMNSGLDKYRQYMRTRVPRKT